MNAPHAPDTWLVSDFEAGRCSKDQIGGPHEPAPTTELAPASPANSEKQSLRGRLTKDALAAYHELGGVEYLKKNPELLDKILARAIAPEPIANTQNNFTFPELPWLTAQRLAYQQTIDVAADIRIVDDKSALPEPPTGRAEPDPIPE